MSAVFEFTGIIREFNTYGDRVTNETPAKILAGTHDEAVEKARAVFGARYDSFRNFWSHRFVVDSVREMHQMQAEGGSGMSAMPEDRAPVGLSLSDLLKKRPADRLAVEAHKERLSRLSEADAKDFRDELVRVIRDQDTALADLGRDQAEAIAGAILSSDWLRKHDAQVWDEGYQTSDAAWAETWDLVTPDEDRTDPRNPYRKGGAE